ncbi:hypothetical protein BU26DRAFT_172198 [Trematosphaeria pertusa]|uniref:Uncharacterized protein n=1 Tax=Trematosphaeria pertusa TaxID=390896 RepID=A0A6A6HV63_9PLEO|nr:uncharacterized protein BU26DRAFT_172198 [Trematosphaeria pertusa]KAF2241901.1 hypothetical protein BU26DRAFT_172198 [Trematosphaeria pertusa]
MADVFFEGERNSSAPSSRQSAAPTLQHDPSLVSRHFLHQAAMYRRKGRQWREEPCLVRAHRRTCNPCQAFASCTSSCYADMTGMAMVCRYAIASTEDRVRALPVHLSAAHVEAHRRSVFGCARCGRRTAWLVRRATLERGNLGTSLVLIPRTDGASHETDGAQLGDPLSLKASHISFPLFVHCTLPTPRLFLTRWNIYTSRDIRTDKTRITNRPTT